MTEDSKGSAASGTGSWKTSIAKDGSFQRKESKFRKWITADGSSGFKAEAGRYHLYISYACPWACRTLMVRKLKGLEAAIGYTAVDWLLAEGGWRFTADKPGCSLDPLHEPSPTFLREIYMQADPEYQGNITVPVLFDRVSNTIVNNESSEIIRMLNSEFNAFSATPAQAALDLYPEPLRKDIDEVNDWVYHAINNGVYKCGFATAQEPYETAFHALFAALDRVEGILSRQRYLCGSQLTLADVRLFTTLVRFDPVYVAHFKCNLRRLSEYPAISGYTRELFQLPGVRETVNMEHIKKHYFMSHRSINPHAVVPIGPIVDFDAPHTRDADFPIKQ